MGVELPAFHEEGDVTESLLVYNIPEITHQLLLSLILKVPLRAWICVNNVNVTIVFLAIGASYYIYVFVAEGH